MAKKLYKFVLVLFFFLSVLRKAVLSSFLPGPALKRSGDVIFGVMFPIYRKDSKFDCKIFNKDSLLWTRALNYALDELERNQASILQNTTYGYQIKDTCVKPALEQALELVHSTKSAQRKDKPNNVLSVLSSDYEKDSSTLFGLFGMPNMIISDLDDVLSRRQKHNFESLKMTFYRTKAVVGLLKYFKWDSVFVIVSEQYEKEYSMFKDLAEIDNICIAGKSKNSEDFTKNVKRSLEIRAVVLYTDELSLLSAIKDTKSVHPSRYTWIDVAGSAQTMTSGNIMTGETILSLRPEFKFLHELRKYAILDCDDKSILKQDDQLPDLCKVDQAGSIALEEIIEILSKNAASPLSKVAQDRTNQIQGVLNGVFTVGKAISRNAETNCWGKTRGDCLSSISSKEIAYELEFLSRNQFLEKPNNLKPLLKKNIFSITSFHGNSSSPREVGTWENAWFINHAAILWPGRLSRPPASTCSPACPTGFVQVAKEGHKCCWSCQACNYNQYIVDNNTCADCLRGYWPTSDYRSCEFKIQVTLMSCAIAISSVSAVLCALVL